MEPAPDEANVFGGAVGEDASRLDIRTSFVTKFDGVAALVPKSFGKARQKQSYNPEDVADVKQLVQECASAETRRAALLGLFKLSLRDGIEGLLLDEGAAAQCQAACETEAKGSGARRAAVQALRNLAGHASTRAALLGVSESLAGVVAEEETGGATRDAALEALVNLSEVDDNCHAMARMPRLLPALQQASQSEPAGSMGREAALKVMQRLQAAMAHPKSSMEQTEEQALQLIEACIGSLAQEAKGSGARVVAMRALKDVVAGQWRDLLMTKQTLIAAVVAAARTESAGSEGRAAAFALLAELAEYPEYRVGLMKVQALAETVVAAVREEATKSSAREGAMYMLARLCLHPDNRPYFMKVDGLVAVCIKAAGQEVASSGGRAAALEALAGLALSSENQLSLIAMAVEGAGDTNARVREAGLNLIASLALLPENCKALLDTPQLVARIVASAENDDADSPSVGAAVEALKSLLGSAAVRGALLDREPGLPALLWNVLSDAEPNSRASTCALGALVALVGADSPEARWRCDAEQARTIVRAVRDANAGSLARTDACRLARKAAESGSHEAIGAAGGAQEMLSKLAAVVKTATSAGARDGDEAPSAVNAFQRVALRRTQLTTQKSMRGINVAPTSPAASLGDAIQALSVLSALSHAGAKFPPTAFDTLAFFATSAAAQQADGAVVDALIVLARVGDCDGERMASLHGMGAFPTLLLPSRADALQALLRLCAADAFASKLGEADFKALLNALLPMAAKDAAAEKLLPMLGCTLHLLFRGSNQSAYALSDTRSQLESALQRLVAAGDDGGVAFEISRFCQAIPIALKALAKRGTSPATSPPKLPVTSPVASTKSIGKTSPPAAPPKSVVVIPSHEGVECASQAAAVAEAVAGVKGFTAIVEDGAGVARAKRRVVVEAAVSAIDQCDMVVLVVSPASHRDGVLRLYAHVAGVKPVVIVGECAGWPAQLVAKKRVGKVEELGSVASW